MVDIVDTNDATKRELATITGVTNVLHYGAVGGGVTIDTEAIKAAVTAAGVNGYVLFPATYTFIADAVINPLQGQTWMGYGSTLKRVDMAQTTLTVAVPAGSGTITISVVDSSIFRVGSSVTFYKPTWLADEEGQSERFAYDVIATDTSANTVDINGSNLANSYAIGDFVVRSTRLINATATDVHVIGLNIDGNNPSYAGTLFHWVNHADLRLDGAGSKALEVTIRDAMKDAFIISGNGSKVIGGRAYNAGGNVVHFSAGEGTKCVDLHVEGSHVTPGTAHQDGVITYSVGVVNNVSSEIYVDGLNTSIALVGGNNSTTINPKVSSCYMKNILPGNDGVALQSTYDADTQGFILSGIVLDNCGDFVVASNDSAQRMLGVEVHACTISQGSFRIVNTDNAVFSNCKADNVGNQTIRGFDLLANINITLDTVTAIGGTHGVNVSTSANTGVKIKNSSFIDNYTRAINEEPVSIGLVVTGGTITATEGIVASGWQGLALTSDAIVTGMTVDSTATSGFTVACRLNPAFKGSLVNFTSINPVGEQSIYVEAVDSTVMNATISATIGFGGSGTLSANSANNNVI